MHRRNLLKASMAIAAYTGLSATGLLTARAWAGSSAADGDAVAFDFEALKSQAKQLAGKPYQDTKQVLPPTLATMTPQNFNAIRYDGNHSLWKDLKGQLDVQFFHVGMGFKQPVRMYSVDPKTRLAREVHFRPSLFNYEKTTVDTKQLKADLGFSGFKLFKAPELDKHDVLSFLGASYFRAVDATGQYGLSARGLAIDTYAKNFRTSPSSGSRHRTRTAPVSWFTPCSIRRAPLAPTVLTSIARPSAW
jgi:glucan biosynthesis protein